MGNSNSRRSQACAEALLAFDSSETEALTRHFHEASRRKQGGDKGDTLDATALEGYLGIGKVLARRLFKAMMMTSAGEGGRPKKSMSFDDFVVAVSKCCSSQRYERRAFWLSLMQVRTRCMCMCTCMCLGFCI
jgi:hypothetical protein